MTRPGTAPSPSSPPSSTASTSSSTAPPAPPSSAIVRAALAPALTVSGLAMAGYLALRPYGDGTDPTTPAAAEAFASPAWVLAHVLGMVALAAIGWATVRLHDVLGSRRSGWARATGVAGAVLVQPYYGAETFGLTVLGRAGRSDPAVLDLVDPVRDHPVAMALFGAGLLLLAMAAVLTALAVRGTTPRPARPWTVWPWAVLVALLLPQFFLPDAGRVGYGLAYAGAAALLVLPRTRRGGADRG